VTWNSKDGQHEGSASAEFPDGRISVGSTAEGVLVQTLAGAYSSATPWAPEVVDGHTAIGWRGTCSCGWTAPLWRRVPSVADADLARRLVHADPGLYGDVPMDVEECIRGEWEAHLPHETLAEVSAAAEAARQANGRLNDAVASARAARQTWAAIGDAAGMTKQSANERWR